VPLPFSHPSDSLDYIVAAVAYAISAVSEELVTRAYLITRLKDLLRSWWQAVLMAAAIFGSYHIYQGLAGMAFATQLGLVYGVAFVMIKRVWPLAIGHMLINLFYTWANSRL
jgi:membrane protease YdiL (CAAX protease family)